MIGDIKMTVSGKSVKIDLRVTAAASTVASMEYSLDSDRGLADCAASRYYFRQAGGIGVVQPGWFGRPEPHQITLRATDARGNVAYQTVTVTVGN